ncbi:LIP-domain-containing protein [Xylariomycetidae sp. FL0641]|nr:LIP-domain-containing protein [Xylariomycetidae sp. FL0641]
MRPLAWFSGFSAIALAQHQNDLFADGSEPIPPSQDPWYRAPAGFEGTAPGTLLRVRAAPGNWSRVLNHSASARHLLYRTTDSRYRPSWAVTTLLTPASPYYAGAHHDNNRTALLSYLFAYDSACVDSAPSYALYASTAGAPALGIPSDTRLVDALLAQGWAVNAPDYEGPDAAFGAAVQAGHATLDAERAVRNLFRLTGSSAENVVTTVLWGYSGGSIAAEAAAELQVQYAPELGRGGQLAGAVLGGLVTDLAATFDRFNGTVIAGDLVNALLGVTAPYPAAAAYLRSRLRPATAGEFLAARDLNTSAAIGFFSQKDIYGYFVGGAADLYARVLRRVYDVEMKLGYHGVPALPMFVYKAIHDEYCPVGQTDAYVDKMCGVGTNITYERNTVGGHIAEIVNGQDRAIQWAWSIFNESYVPPDLGCSVRNVTVNISGLST